MEIKLREKNPNLRLSRSTFLLLLFLFFLPKTNKCFAQQDTVRQGIIKVRRPPVPTSYYVKFDYQYHPARRGHLFQFFRPRVDSSKVILTPPEPVSVVHRADTVNAGKDSLDMEEFSKKNDRPIDGFTWTEWLNQYEHYMAWDDSAGIDSATFVYTVNTNGFVKFKAGTDDGKDSSSTALQKRLLPYMRKLWVWYPATSMDDAGKRRKNISCTATVKVYAVRNDEEKLPIK